ncbi:MAG TPA: dihydrodipicolinate synthase family protein [Pyrinomonadaceae bacterium]|nr:dihydrodipicolinate synthase family protein [Pyrinomonadaceae bacterium]
MKQLHGILLPTTTPFAQNGDLDIEAFSANIRQWNATAIGGYVMLGSTGERVNLDEREYIELITAIRVEVPSEKAFIVGAGQQSTFGTISEVNKAANEGADAVLVLTPYFYRAAITQTALVTHYRAVADAAKAPVMLYSMPALTGIKIEPQTIAELSDHPNIFAVKDSSADIDGLKETVRLVSERGNSDFAVMTGNGTVLCDALKVGAVAGILAVGCVASELCLEIFRAVKEGRIEAADRMQEKLTPLAQAVTTKYGIGGLKAALNFVGFHGGAVRAPLRAPDEAARTEILQLLENAGVEVGVRA